MKNTLKFLIQIAVSLACLYWVYRQIEQAGLMTAAAHLQRIDLLQTVMACLLITGVNVVRLWRLRWWAIRLGGKPQPAAFWLDMYTRSIAFGAFTPARAGEFSRVFSLDVTGLAPRTRMLLVLQEKILDLYGLPFALLLAAGPVAAHLGLAPSIPFTLGVVLLVALIALSVGTGRFLGLGGLACGWAGTVAVFVIYLLANVCLFRAAGSSLGLADVAAIAIASGVVAALPVSFGGIGMREGSLVTLLSLWQVEKGVQLAIIALESFLNLLLPILLYLLWLGVRFWLRAGKRK